MIVARPVRSATDTVLLAKGMALDECVIRILVSLGVTDVYVEEMHDAAPPSAHENAARRAIAERERKRFGDVSDDPYMAALLAATIELKSGDWERWGGVARASVTPAPQEDGAPDA